MINQTQSRAPRELAFTDLELRNLDKLAKTPPHLASVACPTRLAQLGGYLARASDPLPGKQVIWKGMARLTDIEFGYLLAKESVGT